MYLTENQVNQILNNSYFSQPVTESVVLYDFYRGHVNATVHTLRYNLTREYNEENMIQHVLAYLMSQFPLNSTLLVSVNYDLLLGDVNSQSFYIWRANSNARSFNENEEFSMVLTYDNVYRFVTGTSQIHIPDLNINFRDSKVVIKKALAIVFSFVQI
jgi:hypothetical protein